MSDRETRRRVVRKWLWLHPHRTAWRSLMWLYWKGIPPWRVTAFQLAFVNPAPLSASALGRLRRVLRERGGA